MTLSYLESLKGALVADTNISGMVDGKIYKFKALEKSEPDLRAATHKSLISCELKDWNGRKGHLRSGLHCRYPLPAGE